MIKDDLAAAAATIRAEVERLNDLAASLEEKAGSTRDRPSQHSGRMEVADEITDDFLTQEAENLYSDRRLRSKFLQNQLFGEPFWDLCLDLYYNHQRGRKLSVTSACFASHVPSTTALRYIAKLEADGLIIRTISEHDDRLTFLVPSQALIGAINGYLITRSEQQLNGRKREEIQPSRAALDE